MKSINLFKIIPFLAFVLISIACNDEQELLNVPRMELPQKCLLTNVHVNGILSSEYHYDNQNRIIFKRGYLENREILSEIVYSYLSKSKIEYATKSFKDNQETKSESGVYKLNEDGTLQQAESGDYKEIYSYDEDWMKLERFSEGRYSGYTVIYYNMDDLTSQSYRYNSDNQLSHRNENFYSENPNPDFSILMPMYKLEMLRDHLLEKVEVYPVGNGIEYKGHVREHKYIEVTDLQENEVALERTLTYYEDYNEIRKIEIDTLVYKYDCN